MEFLLENSNKGIMPKVSIIVPIYNVEKYLDRCMMSLINQTLRDIEIIMVDDGSPDRCPQMCDEYARRDSRIKVIHKENGGLGYARNSGLEIAIGEYIAFVDSDDYVDTTMYETLYDNAVKRNSDVIFCGFKKEFKEGQFLTINECDKPVDFIDRKKIDEIALDFIASAPYCKEQYKYEMSVWHSIYRHEIIKENQLRFISERQYISEDLPFQLDFFSKAQTVSFIPDIFYVYCFNTGSLTKNYRKDMFDRIKALHRLINSKIEAIDVDGLRNKRLFIGSVRAITRMISASPISFVQKRNYVKDIFDDEIWRDIRSVYKTSYLPIHQKIMLLCCYNKKYCLALLYAKILDSKLLTIIRRRKGKH